MKHLNFRDYEIPEKSLWDRARFYVFGVLIATVILLALVIATAHAEEMTASWYSRASLIKEGTWKHGEQRMANGDVFSDSKLTAASNRWPLGTTLLVRNLRTGASVRIIISDRIGKRFSQTRIDLSKGAFKKIADLSTGVVEVEVSRV